VQFEFMVEVVFVRPKPGATASAKKATPAKGREDPLLPNKQQFTSFANWLQTYLTAA
jgi:hypothetical protein